MNKFFSRDGCVLLLCLAMLAGGLGAAEKGGMAARIDAMVKPFFPAGRPGVAVIAVRDGQVLFRQAYGSANLELNVPLQPDTLLRIGSVTKQFTAAAVMMLAEKGKLSLQDPITKFLPDYPTQGHVITIEHLLTHTSGIQSVTEMPGVMENRIQTERTLDELIDTFKREPMHFAPGTQFEYNNSGFILLGAVIEKASGEKYEEFIQNHIFAPLGMKNTRVGYNQPIIPHRAAGYSEEGGKIVNARYLGMSNPHAAGALISTVDDLALWDTALYSEKILTQKSLKKMWTPYTLANGTSTGYGYGWAIGTLRGSPMIEHGGGIFGFVCDVVRLPQEHVYVAVLANTDSPTRPPAMLAHKIAALVIGKPFPEYRPVRVDPKVLARYAGVYRINETSTRTVTVENGKLFTQRSGGAKLEAFSSSETEFFYETSLSRFSFVVGPDGRVTEMLMYQEGNDVPERALRVADAPPAKH